jgi:ABC-type transporter Mla MlaB component
MFRITLRTRGDEIVMKLEGRLAGACVRELDVCWSDIARTVHESVIHVDLTDVSHVDEMGQVLLTRMYRAGVRFIARGCVMPELVREIAAAVTAGQER